MKWKSIHTSDPQPQSHIDKRINKLPLRFFSIEAHGGGNNYVIRQFETFKKHHEPPPPEEIYTTYSKISEGAHGEVYAAKDQTKESYAIKIVQDTVKNRLASARIHEEITSSTFPSKTVVNALREANIIYSLKNQANIIRLHSAGYNIRETIEEDTSTLCVSVILVLEIGTRFTLRDFFPLHLVNFNLLKADEGELRKKYSLSVDSITCMPGKAYFVDCERGVNVFQEVMVLPLLELSLSVLDSALRLHRKSLVHRDFKPENFIFCRLHSNDIPEHHSHSLYNIYYESSCISNALQMIADDMVDGKRLHALKLIDFGCAVDFSLITKERSIGGTAQYTSPEIAKVIVNSFQKKDQLFTKRDLIMSDVWSIGIVLLEMILGKCHTGLIEGMFHRSRKNKKAELNTTEIDMTILDFVSSLNRQSVASYTFRCLEEAEKTFQKKFGGIQNYPIIPREWIQSVLSLVNPNPSRRASLRSVYLVCRRLIAWTRRHFFLTKGASKKKVLVNPKKHLRENVEKEKFCTQKISCNQNSQVEKHEIMIKNDAFNACKPDSSEYRDEDYEMVQAVSSTLVESGTSQLVEDEPSFSIEPVSNIFQDVVSTNSSRDTLIQIQSDRKENNISCKKSVEIHKVNTSSESEKTSKIEALGSLSSHLKKPEELESIADRSPFLRLNSQQKIFYSEAPSVLSIWSKSSPSVVETQHAFSTSIHRIFSHRGDAMISKRREQMGKQVTGAALRNEFFQCFSSFPGLTSYRENRLPLKYHSSENNILTGKSLDLQKPGENKVDLVHSFLNDIEFSQIHSDMVIPQSNSSKDIFRNEYSSHASSQPGIPVNEACCPPLKSLKNPPDLSGKRSKMRGINGEDSWIL